MRSLKEWSWQVKAGLWTTPNVQKWRRGEGSNQEDWDKVKGHEENWSGITKACERTTSHKKRKAAGLSAVEQSPGWSFLSDLWFGDTGNSQHGQTWLQWCKDRKQSEGPARNNSNDFTVNATWWLIQSGVGSEEVRLLFLKRGIFQLVGVSIEITAQRRRMWWCPRGRR